MKKTVKDVEVEVEKFDFVDWCILEAQVGTTGMKGGDTGHGGRTYIKMEDVSSCDIDMFLTCDRNGEHGGVIIEAGGDAELQVLADAFLKIGQYLKDRIDKSVDADRDMTLNEYQEKAMRTMLKSCNNFSYMMLNLVGEVGEFASKVAKAIRKGVISINDTAVREEIADYGRQPIINGFLQEYGDTECSMEYASDYISKLSDLKEGLIGEAGDILWQLAGLLRVLGMDLDMVAQYNLIKLSKRADEGTIAGDGDGATKEEGRTA